jgi:hypothetical protein
VQVPSRTDLKQLCEVSKTLYDEWHLEKIRCPFVEYQPIDGPWVDGSSRRSKLLLKPITCKSFQKMPGQHISVGNRRENAMEGWLKKATKKLLIPHAKAAYLCKFFTVLKTG